MLAPGPSSTPTLSDRASSPRALPTSWASSRFQVEDSPTAGGKQVAGSDCASPMWSVLPVCRRTPCGPSVRMTRGSSASGTAVLFQKSEPPVRAILLRMGICSMALP